MFSVEYKDLINEPLCLHYLRMSLDLDTPWVPLHQNVLTCFYSGP